jgi:hypothetical protein
MIIYDIESICPVAPKDDTERLDGIHYAAGWTDYTGMGIACIGAFDLEAGQSRVFGGTLDELERFAALAAGRPLIGWNNHPFDDRVLEAHGVEVIGSWDLKAALIAAGCGGQRNNSLDAFAAANLGPGQSKRGHGAIAPIWWQRGLRERVIDYCLQDVHLTHRLLQHLTRTGELISPITGKPLRPAIPPEIQCAVEDQLAAGQEPTR